MEIKIETPEYDGELYHRYPGQERRQDALLCLDIETGRLWAGIDPEIGGAVPMRVWHGTVIRWVIAPLRVEALTRLMERVRPYAETICEHSRVEWDGNDYVRRSDAEGGAAVDAITSIIDGEPWSEADVYDPWDAVDRGGVPMTLHDYQILNQSSGLSLGVYSGEDEEGAIRAMLADANAPDALADADVCARRLPAREAGREQQQAYCIRDRAKYLDEIDILRNGPRW